MSQTVGSNVTVCRFDGLVNVLACGSGKALLTNYSIESLLTAQIIAAASCTVSVCMFLFLQFHLPELYWPQFRPTREGGNTSLHLGKTMGRLKLVFRTPETTIISECGLDSYFFLRYLHMLLRTFAMLTAIVIPTLLPVNLTGDAKGVSGLDRLSIAAIGASQASRLWVHLIVAVIAILWVLFAIYSELRAYIRIRHAYLISPEHRTRASATTVLITGIPHRLTSIELADMYSFLPGGVKNIWINRNFDQLSKKTSYRESVAQSLESAETTLIQLCWIQYNKRDPRERSLAEKMARPTTWTDDVRRNLPADSPLDLQDDDRVRSNETDQSGADERITTAFFHHNPAEQRQGAGGASYREHVDPAPTISDTVSNLHTHARLPPLHGSLRLMEHAVSRLLCLVKDLVFTSPHACHHEGREGTRFAAPGRECTDRCANRVNKLASNAVSPSEDCSQAEITYMRTYTGLEDKGEPKWRTYIKAEDREVIRLPVFALAWLPAIPFVGRKVDKIYHLRGELARLNVEIEADQLNAETCASTGSAFIQFNSQIAAHMCCQSLSHHIPMTMASRHIEISPDDVIWENMSMQWYERCVRTVVMGSIRVLAIIIYAVPVTLSSLLAQINTLAASIPRLRWFLLLPGWLRNIIAGYLPSSLMTVTLMAVPILLRSLITREGVITGTARELGVQRWYFAFLFIQLFLVVTVSGGLAALLGELTDLKSAPRNFVSMVGKSIPRASDYFFYYLTVHALSTSSMALMQCGSLFDRFVLGPLFDSTARAKWIRRTRPVSQSWGSFFPPFTTFASIGIIYSVVSPLILLFLLPIYGLYWVVYRYNILCVYRFQVDTGGLLYPVAVKQLFIGVYFLEVCLIGLLLTNTNDDGVPAAYPQAIIMCVVLVLTVVYQAILDYIFNPLYRHIPITLERQLTCSKSLTECRSSRSDMHDRDTSVEATNDLQCGWINHCEPVQDSGSSSMTPRSVCLHHQSAIEDVCECKFERRPSRGNSSIIPEDNLTTSQYLKRRAGITQRGFRHWAVQDREPIIWIPKDLLGVSDDEIWRTKRMSFKRDDDRCSGIVGKPNIRISNVATNLDGKGKVIVVGGPPSYLDVDQDIQ